MVMEEHLLRLLKAVLYNILRRKTAQCLCDYLAVKEETLETSV